MESQAARPLAGEMGPIPIKCRTDSQTWLLKTRWQSVNQFMAQYGTASFENLVEAREGGAQSIASVQAALDGVWLQGLSSDQKCLIYKAKQCFGGGKQRFLIVAGEKL